MHSSKIVIVFFYLLVAGLEAAAQITVPYSSSLDLNFGRGTVNPGPPLSVGKTDFPYTANVCPQRGYYTVVNKIDCGYIFDLESDAGITYNGAFQHAFPESDSGGYMMVVNAPVSKSSILLFEDTVKNLCSGGYLFWAGISRLNNSSCVYPNFTMNVETTSGQVIQSFQTGNVGGPGDNGTYYVGFSPLLTPAPKSTFPYFYGTFFTLPAGISNVVVKIILNPSNAFPDCNVLFAIDNILVTPVGSTPAIQIPNGTGWIAGTCSQGSSPLALNGSLTYDSLIFGYSKYASPPYANPAFQWQQSLDGGYTWTDIFGETNINLSHHFSTTDTFLVRLRVSDALNIGNPNCSVVSNVIKVEADGPPEDYSFTSNSPVCEDSDLVFHLSGGASYTIAGPNGYSDNSAFPHRYHPQLADSGWYYANIISFGGCVVQDSLNIKIVGPLVKMGDAVSVCYGTPAQLSASGGIKYFWSPASGLSDRNASDPVAIPAATTKYTVKVTDNSGCSAFGDQTVAVRDTLLKAQIEIPDFACPNDTINIRDSSVGNVTSWSWDFGNGHTSSLQNPPPQFFMTSGTTATGYQVRLIISDSAGCYDTASRLIRSVPNCYIAVPNAFTPNGDGLNDYLYPLNAYRATDLTFKVYNRFGQLMFQTHDWTQKWDGLVRGEPQPMGVYVWVLQYTDEKNKKVFLKGFTTLIR